MFYLSMYYAFSQTENSSILELGKMLVSIECIVKAPKQIPVLYTLQAVHLPNKQSLLDMQQFGCLLKYYPLEGLSCSQSDFQAPHKHL